MEIPLPIVFLGIIIIGIEAKNYRNTVVIFSPLSGWLSSPDLPNKLPGLVHINYSTGGNKFLGIPLKP